MYFLSKNVYSGLALLISIQIAHAQAKVDFNNEGDFDTQFSGGIYTEQAAGGINNTRCLTLASIVPTSFDGSLSEFYPAGEFTVGKSFTVGAYFKMDNLGTGAGRTAHILRLGITNGGNNNFGNTPFSTISVSDPLTGQSRFFARDTYGNHTTPFTLNTGSWYYFETTFTRGENTLNTEGLPTNLSNITYDMYIAESSADGTIGSVLSRFNHTMDSVSFVTQLNGKIYGAFRGESAYVNGASGVLDDFTVKKVQLPPAIVDLNYDSSSRTAEITFSSQISVNYSLWGSADLSTWSELTADIPGAAGNVTLTHSHANAVPNFFYQIREN